MRNLTSKLNLTQKYIIVFVNRSSPATNLILKWSKWNKVKNKGKSNINVRKVPAYYT